MVRADFGVKMTIGLHIGEETLISDMSDVQYVQYLTKYVQSWTNTAISRQTEYGQNTSNIGQLQLFLSKQTMNRADFGVKMTGHFDTKISPDHSPFVDIYSCICPILVIFCPILDILNI